MFRSMLEHDFENMFVRRGLSSNIKKTEEGLKIFIEVPGLKREDIKVELKNNELRIEATYKKEAEDDKEKETYLLCERVPGIYRRIFRVNNSTTEGDIHAKLEDGVLVLTIDAPKQEEKKSITIE